MKNRLFTIISCTLLLFAAGCKNNIDEPEEPVSLNGNEARPSWTAPEEYDMTASMTAIVKVDLSLTYPEQVAAMEKEIVSQGDVLAAFAGENCVGVAEFVNGYFFIYITDGGENICLKYYNNELKNVFVSEETVVFRNDAQLGRLGEPYTPKFVKEK